MQIGHFSGPVNYEPSSRDQEIPVQATETGKPFVHRIEREIVRRKIKLTDDFTQAGERYRSFNKLDKEHLIDNLIADLLTSISRYRNA